MNKRYFIVAAKSGFGRQQIDVCSYSLDDGHRIKYHDDITPSSIERIDYLFRTKNCYASVSENGIDITVFSN